jgi:hypothetical protein
VLKLKEESKAAEYIEKVDGNTTLRMWMSYRCQRTNKKNESILLRRYKEPPRIKMNKKSNI